MKRKIQTCLIVATIATVGIIIVVALLQSKKDENVEAVRTVENEIYEILTQLDEIYTSEPDDTANQIGEFIYSNMTYQVVEVNTTYCIVSVSAPNLYDVFFSLFDSEKYATTSDMKVYEEIVAEILLQIYGALVNGEYTIRSVNVEVPLDEYGNIVMTQELVDAMCGGLLTLQEEITRQYIEAMGK